MPIALLLQIIEAIAAVAPQVPEILTLVESARQIVVTGTVTDEQEAAIRQQLDAVKAIIDAAA